MSKELTALEALKEIKDYVINGHSLSLETEEKGFTLIETALKKLDKPKEIVGTTTVDKALEQFLIDSCPEVAKKLKALEIIKEHLLDIDWFLQFVKQDISYQHYVYCVEQSNNAFAKRFLLNKEEYELLKEILK